MAEYIVEEVFEAVPAQWGKQRVAFRVQGNPNKLSGFFLAVPQAGEKLIGEIVQKGQYWNFNFGQKDSSASFGAGPSNAEIKNFMEFKMVPLLQTLAAQNDRILHFVTGEEIEAGKLNKAFEDAIGDGEIPF